MTLWELLTAAITRATPIAITTPTGLAVGTPRRVLLHPDGSARLELHQPTRTTTVHVPAIRSRS